MVMWSVFLVDASLRQALGTIRATFAAPELEEPEHDPAPYYLIPT